eukprot:4999908-Prymnesium_polylepis.1
MLRPKLVCFISHGECSAELPAGHVHATPVHGDPYLDAPLTAAGRQQAAAQRRLLEGLPFGLVAVAPQTQCVDTAVE